ncbi:MAG: DnaJ domain-containing protein, partial [Magnetococcales bacterium]|nr:DnaJ domain-containing protein [Magnetococcales bacterium]
MPEHRSAPWYVILQLTPDATPDEIKRAYRRLMNQYHPDRVVGLGEDLVALAEHKAKQLNSAYAEALRALKQQENVVHKDAPAAAPVREDFGSGWRERPAAAMEPEVRYTTVLGDWLHNAEVILRPLSAMVIYGVIVLAGGYLLKFLYESGYMSVGSLMDRFAQDRLVVAERVGGEGRGEARRVREGDSARQGVEEWERWTLSGLDRTERERLRRLYQVAVGGDVRAQDQ